MINTILPNFYGVFEVKHYTKGRIRVKIESLKNQNEKNEELKSKLLKLKGINKVDINGLLGTVLINFDEVLLKPNFVIGILLNLLGLEEKVFEHKNGKVSDVLKELLKNVDVAIYSKSKGILDLKTTLVIILLIYGVKKIRQNPILPSGVNLLWWAYNLIGKRGE